MTKPELGRGERVIPGVWRLRLPLPWPGVPHGNAYAVSDVESDGLLLIDCGTNLRGSFDALELALAQVGLSLDRVRRLVITHAHVDHWGQAQTIIQQTGADLWLSPNLDHARANAGDGEAAIAHRLEIGRQSGVPERPLRDYLERVRDMPTGLDAVLEPDVELVSGVRIPTGIGDLITYETPGHAPSHVSFYNAEHRLLISGDHLLGRVSPYFEFGYSPDPAGEFLDSLDVVDALDTRLCISGHGRPFTDVHAHVEANRALVSQRIAATRAGLADMPLTALELIPAIFGEGLTPTTASWRLPEALSYLIHLERLGTVAREHDEGSGVERWRADKP